MAYSHRKRYGSKRYFNKYRWMKKQNRRRYWRKLTKPELKTVVVHEEPEINNGGTLQYLTTMTQGTTDVTRVGNKILIKYLWMKANIIQHATGLDQTVRIVIIRDNAPDGALPAWTDIYNTVDIYAFRNRDRLCRFRILYDKCYEINRPSEEGSEKFIKKFIKLNKPVWFNDTAAADVTAAQKGCLYIGMVGTEATGNTCAHLNYNTQIGFTDL